MRHSRIDHAIGSGSRQAVGRGGGSAACDPEQPLGLGPLELDLPKLLGVLPGKPRSLVPLPPATASDSACDLYYSSSRQDRQRTIGSGNNQSVQIKTCNPDPNRCQSPTPPIAQPQYVFRPPNHPATLAHCHAHYTGTLPCTLHWHTAMHATLAHCHACHTAMHTRLRCTPDCDAPQTAMHPRLRCTPHCHANHPATPTSHAVPRAPAAAPAGTLCRATGAHCARRSAPQRGLRARSKTVRCGSGLRVARCVRSIRSVSGVS
jgi:hypothetical protein